MGRKNKKKRNRFLDYAGYIGLRAVTAVLFAIGIKRSLKLARLLGRLMWDHYNRGRARALENLKNSYPEKSDEWITQTGKRSFQHLVMLVVDIMFTARLLRRQNWRRFVKLINAERCKWLIAEQNGVILVTPHYGNFEIIGYMLGLFGFDIYSIARPIDNPYINDWLYGLRQQHSQRIIDKKGASRLMPEILEKGAALGFIADQDAGRKGIFVDFFGRKASTYKSIALLAVTENLPVVVGVCRQHFGEFFFEIECGDVITPAEWAEKDDPIGWVSQKYTSEMERLIRKDPSQYWWLHRRWKSRPKGEAKTAATANLSYRKK